MKSSSSSSSDDECLITFLTALAGCFLFEDVFLVFENVDIGNEGVLDSDLGGGFEMFCDVALGK